uniref:Uncharacterized protein n=1 Tax=Cannabis sativa TaxID=3483 RepID=A0A803NIU4_CANSA
MEITFTEKVHVARIKGPLGTSPSSYRGGLSLSLLSSLVWISAIEGCYGSQALGSSCDKNTPSDAFAATYHDEEGEEDDAEGDVFRNRKRSGSALGSQERWATMASENSAFIADCIKHQKARVNMLIERCSMVVSMMSLAFETLKRELAMYNKKKNEARAVLNEAKALANDLVNHLVQEKVEASLNNVVISNKEEARMERRSKSRKGAKDKIQELEKKFNIASKEVDRLGEANEYGLCLVEFLSFVRYAQRTLGSSSGRWLCMPEACSST